MEKDLKAINELFTWIGLGMIGLFGAGVLAVMLYWVVVHWQASAVGALTLAGLVLASQWEEN